MAERTEDDLRTRAREAAEEAYRKPRWHVGTITDRLIEAFYEGYLAHAAQQPTRELAAHDREVKAAAWDEGYSWGWSDAQEAHDVRQEMDRSEWRLSMPNPYRIESEARP